MPAAIVMGPPLIVALVAALVAGRRGWAPPLWLSLSVGAALRLLIMIFAVLDSAEPYDFKHDFTGAADHVLDGHNPTLHMREGGWHFLPLLAYVLAGQRLLGDLLGLPWGVVGRLVPILADLALIPLVARLASDRGALRAFQYACVPIAVLVSGYHGQLVSITLLFAVAAMLAARSGRAHAAGALIGLSLSCTHWSVLLVPGVVLSVRGVRSRLTVLGWTAAVPAVTLLSSSVFLDTPFSRLPELARAIISTRPVVGDWGWSTLVTGGAQMVVPELGRIGLPILLVALVAAGWWWRRAEPIDLTIVVVLVFLIVTYRLGAQYLLWPMPYLIARGLPRAWPAIAAACLWAAFGYLRLYELAGVTWSAAHAPWAYSSFLAIALLAAALPWGARHGSAGPAAEPAEPADVPEPAGAGEKGKQAGSRPHSL